MAAPRRPKVSSKPRPPSARGACASGAACSIGDLFRILGKPHVLDLLYLVMVEDGGGPRRFVDLQQRLGLSPNTLSERLRELVKAGLLTRTAYNEMPPRVDYNATAKARDLLPAFGTLRDWAERHNLEPVPATVGASAEA